MTEVLRNGARALLAQAVEAEVSALLDCHAERLTDDGRQRLVRHGHLPEREVMTGIGPVTMRCPRVRDRIGEGYERIRFSSANMPPYARRSKSLEVLIPVLYLKGVSTGDFEEALIALLSKDAGGLSASTIGRLKDASSRSTRAGASTTSQPSATSTSGSTASTSRLAWRTPRSACWSSSGPPRGQEGTHQPHRRRARECAILERLLLDLNRRGLAMGPELAVADGALGFWQAIEQVWPHTRGQRCWVHKTANVLNKLPKSQQPKAKRALQEIWMAETKKDALAAFDAFIETWGVKYDKAVECLIKDRDALLAFYDFPAEHWKHLRTTNVIESSFATVRHRTVRSKGCLSNKTALAMIFKLAEAAEKSWRRLDGHNQLPKVILGVKFADGIEVVRSQAQAAAA